MRTNGSIHLICFVGFVFIQKMLGYDLLDPFDNIEAIHKGSDTYFKQFVFPDEFNRKVDFFLPALSKFNNCLIVAF